MDAPEHWGTSTVERARRTPADELVAVPRARWTRGVTSSAAPGQLWRWLCQLTVAPYSYDLLDNLGRPSPRTLTPGADHLHVGQRLLVLFVIDSFVDGEHLTLRLHRPGRGVLGEFAITYAVLPDGPGRTRLVATVVVGGTPAPSGAIVRHVLAWGDLIMMRRQVTRLAALATESPDWAA